MSSFKWSKENDEEYQSELIKKKFTRLFMELERKQLNDKLTDEEYIKNSAWIERLTLIRDGKISKKKKAIENIKRSMMFKKLK